MGLFDCVDERTAWALIAESVLLWVLYWWVALFRMLPAAKAATSRQSRTLWLALAVAFLFCGLCSYGTTVLAGWFPHEACIAKSVLILLGIGSCAAFLWFSRGHVLSATAVESAIEKVDQEMAARDNMTAEEALRLLRTHLSGVNGAA